MKTFLRLIVNAKICATSYFMFSIASTYFVSFSFHAYSLNIEYVLQHL